MVLCRAAVGSDSVRSLIGRSQQTIGPLVWNCRLAWRTRFSSSWLSVLGALSRVVGTRVSGKVLSGTRRGPSISFRASFAMRRLGLPPVVQAPVVGVADQVR